MGDAFGVLYDALKLKAKDPNLNAIICYLALVVAPTGQSMQGAHVRSERNSVCDELSRMSTGIALPQLLAFALSTVRRNAEFTFL